MTLVVGFMSLAVFAAEASPDGAPASVPTTTSAPARLPDRPEITRIGLEVEVRDRDAHAWLYRPAGHGPGQAPPLIIVLHGTDDTARDMIDFWTARTLRVPSIVAAPQGIGPGWRDTDVATVRVLLEHLQEEVPYDESRVLLAGFSAGGAMALHLLYEERLPVTAIAALANYVPPRVTSDQMHARRHVPVFYAVGMADVNHDLMREGLQRLRKAGVNAHLYRPSIGHVLDADAAQTALDWFFDQCATERIRRIEEASAGAETARHVVELEAIVTTARWHEEEYVKRAREVLERLEASGWKEIATARNLLAEGRAVAAVDKLTELERTYGHGRLGRAARSIRLNAEADPEVRALLNERAARRRAELAMAMYNGARRLAGQDKAAEAAEMCRRTLRLYRDTPGAERARKLLETLETRSAP